MTIYKIEQKAISIRESIIKMLLSAGSGHSAGPLGLADIFAALYFRILKVRPKTPHWPQRDRLILSNGHVVPVLYATLAEAGFFPKARLSTLRRLGSGLQGHPVRGLVPGIENTGGPLGQGVSVAVGQALAAKLKKESHHIFCLTSDAEQQEGEVWEAYMSAVHFKLSNITFILDRNNIQSDGFTEEIMSLEPLAAKFAAFGLHVLEVDGHNIKGIIDTISEARAIFERPVMIIAHTIPGKGVDFMEFDHTWHGQSPSGPEAKKALHELRTLEGRIRSDHD